MSSSFAGGTTRGMNELDKEIEYRLNAGRNYGAFDEDFRAPGASEAFPGGDHSKSKQPFEAPHDDFGASELEMLDGEVGPGEFHKRVECRMRELVSGTAKADNPDLFDQRNK